jgi:hypothetical protein
MYLSAEFPHVITVTGPNTFTFESSDASNRGTTNGTNIKFGWVSLSGNGSSRNIRNVSSSIYLGRYTLNFETALPTDTYAISGLTGKRYGATATGVIIPDDFANSTIQIYNTLPNGNNPQRVNSVDIATSANGINYDFAVNSIMIVG